MSATFLVGVSHGPGRSPTPAYFEWMGASSSLLISYMYGDGASEPIRLLLSRDSVVEAAMLSDGGYFPALLLHVWGSDHPLCLVFSKYTHLSNRDWRSVVMEIVHVWGTSFARYSRGEGDAAFSTHRTLPPTHFPHPTAVARAQDLSCWTTSPAAVSAHDYEAQSQPVGTTARFNQGLGDSVSFGPDSFSDESAIAHAIVLFVSHARVSKDCRGGRSRKAYRLHMTHTALSAMCAVAEVLGSDVLKESTTRGIDCIDADRPFAAPKMIHSSVVNDSNSSPLSSSSSAVPGLSVCPCASARDLVQVSSVTTSKVFESLVHSFLHLNACNDAGVFTCDRRSASDAHSITRTGRKRGQRF
jgi:hypothetical protein